MYTKVKCKLIQHVQRFFNIHYIYLCYYQKTTFFFIDLNIYIYFYTSKSGFGKTIIISEPYSTTVYCNFELKQQAGDYRTKHCYFFT